MTSQGRLLFIGSAFNKYVPENTVAEERTSCLKDNAISSSLFLAHPTLSLAGMMGFFFFLDKAKEPVAKNSWFSFSILCSIEKFFYCLSVKLYHELFIFVITLISLFIKQLCTLVQNHLIGLLLTSMSFSYRSDIF